MRHLILNAGSPPKVRSKRSRILLESGFAVAEAASGVEVRRLAAELQPSLILINGPISTNDSGVWCRLRSNPSTREIPVILTSGHRCSASQTYRRLADSWLPEPVDPAKLVFAVRQLLHLPTGPDSNHGTMERSCVPRPEPQREQTEPSHAAKARTNAGVIGDSQALRAVAEGVPELFFILDSALRVQYVSKYGSKYAGAQLHALPWESFLHPDDRASVRSAVAEGLSTESPIHAMFRVRVGAGGYRWYQSRCWPVQTGSGLQWFGYTSDIHELVSLKLEVEARLEAAYRSPSSDARMNLPLYDPKVGHDLLSPLTTICSLSAWISGEYGHSLGVGGREYLDLLQKSVDRMSAVVYDLLDQVFDVSDAEQLSSV